MPGLLRDQPTTSRSVSETVVDPNSSGLNRFAIVHPAIHIEAAGSPASGWDAAQARFGIFELHVEILALHRPVLGHRELPAAAARQARFPFISGSLIANHARERRWAQA